MVESGQHNHGDLGVFDVHFAQRVQAAELWHAQVHQHHIGFELAPQLYGFKPVTGFADHLDTVFHIKNGHQAAPHQRLVVGDEHAYGFG